MLFDVRVSTCDSGLLCTGVLLHVHVIATPSVDADDRNVLGDVTVDCMARIYFLRAHKEPGGCCIQMQS